MTTMSTMSSPPVSPTHHRRPSSISIGSTRSARLSLSRRSSAVYSPTHSRVGSSHGGMGDNLAAELGESLADELGGWDEEDDEDEERFDEEASLPNGAHERERDSGIDVASSPHIKDSTSANVISLSPATSHNAKNKHYHSRKPSDYDGSGYGSESDLEATDLISASLEARLAAVEAMARRGMEENGSEGDKVVSRFTERLKDLGGLMGVEQGAK